ncbi:FAD-dependent oxidoreductase [Nocardia thailandica]
MSGHAVVVGAGFAGLLAARALSDAFDRVTVLERDTHDGSVSSRRGVPQAAHLHGLLDRGRAVLEELHPGCTAELLRRGANAAEVLVGTRWYAGGGRLASGPTGLTSILATRPLLEAVLRERTLALPGVALRTGVSARGLAGDATRVEAVLVDGPEGTGAVPADLIVDASGRGSRAGDWLTGIGAQAPAEERLEVDLGYASRYYRHRHGQLDGQSSVIVSTGADGRGGGAVLVEGGRWHITLAGMLGDHPPVDEAGFAAYAASLAAPDIDTLVAGSEPLSAIVPYRFRTAVRRRFDRLPAPPVGFVVIGDAMTGFNPLYAQGMTVAALQARALRATLAADPDPARLPARYHVAAHDAAEVAWQLSTGSDLNHPGVAGVRTARTRLTAAYVRRVQHAARHDPNVARAFLRVAHLVDPPAALAHPLTAGRVLLGGTVFDRTRHTHRQESSR